MKKLALILWALLVPTIAAAQGPTGLWYLNINGGRSTVGVNDPLPGGFKIQSFGTPISVTTSNSTGTLPTGSPIVIADNVGANAAYCALGASATTSSKYIPAGSSFPFIVIGATQLTCITSSSTTTINMTAGYGNAGSSGGGASGGGGGGSVTQGTSPWVDNITQLGGNAINLGAGNIGTGTIRTVEASDSALIAAINAAVPCLNATAFNTNSYTTGQTNPANCDLNGGLYVHPPANQTVRTTAGATGGGTLSSAIAPATPAGVNLKASAGSVFRIFATTIQATPVYIKFYNASSAPTCGSGTPIGRFMVPVAATAANGAGTNIDIGDIGVAFGTGIGYCVTGALADNDTTAITANNTLVNIVWN